jgi:flagellar hook protein FlgE
MLRSLFAGISGLSNHQLMLDVVGNNIANVNTIGFKSSRVTFREMITQTLRGASRPISGSFGGTNPSQVGLGATIQSIDPSFSQGSLQTTGKITDLAIEGDSFFILETGDNRMYTRAGSFEFDGLGQLVSAGTGGLLQGVMADTDGNVDLGQPIETIRVSSDLVTPAQATETIQISGNLDADSDSQGSVLMSASFLAAAQDSDLLTHLYRGSNGYSLQVPQLETISVDGQVGATSLTGSFTVQSSSTVNDLLAWLNSLDPNATFTLDGSGAIRATAGAANISNLKLVIGGNTEFNQALSFDANILAGTSGTTIDELRGPAVTGDLLENLYDASGKPIDLATATAIQINGDLGGIGISPHSFTLNPATTTVQDLMDNMEAAFQITNTEGVQLDDRGRVIIYGDNGESASISDIDIDVPGLSDVTFSSAFDWNTIQSARDPQSWRTTATVFDSLGREMNVGFTFTKRSDSNLWDWTADVPGTNRVLQGGSGTVSFGDDGRLQSFNFTDRSGSLVIDPGNGAEILQIALDPGEFGSLDGLLQFKGDFTAVAKDFDGHGAGKLQGITINKNGEVMGQFSNGTVQILAQIALAEFNNNSGLLRQGSNMFAMSSNSGPEYITYVGVNAAASIAPGALEMSNVDLGAEFTQMIVAQRGFQANARIISVGDEILSELVTLKGR